MRIFLLFIFISGFALAVKGQNQPIMPKTDSVKHTTNKVVTEERLFGGVDPNEIRFTDILNTSFFMSVVPYAESDDRTKQSISVNGQIGLQGNAIDMNTLKHVLFTDSLTDNDKNNMINKLKNYNHFYYSSQYNINYYRQTKLKWLCGYSLQASSMSYLKAAFSRDAFVLATEGNAAYENQTASFNNTIVQSVNMSTAGGTMIFKALKGKLHIGITGEFVAGLNNTDVNMSQGSLYTAPYGEYINATAQADIKTTDTTHKNISNFKGYGYRVGGFVELNISRNDILTISAQNIGQIFWNSKSLEYKIDTSLHFDGVNSSSLFNTTSSNASFSTDSLLKLTGVKALEQRYIQNLAPLFSINYLHYIHHIETSVGLKASTYTDWRYSSSLKLYGIHYFRHHWQAGVSATYYAGNVLGTGIIVGKSWKHVHVYLNSDNFLQYWRLGHITCENISARIAYSF